jgi:hypothetical protein
MEPIRGMTYCRTVPSFRVLPASTRSEFWERSIAGVWRNKLRPHYRVSFTELGNLPLLPLSRLDLINLLFPLQLETAGIRTMVVLHGYTPPFDLRIQLISCWSFLMKSMCLPSANSRSLMIFLRLTATGLIHSYAFSCVVLLCINRDPF